MDHRRKKPLGDQGDIAGDVVDPVLLKKRVDSAERSRRYRARQKELRSTSPLSTVNAYLSPLSDVTNLVTPTVGGSGQTDVEGRANHVCRENKGSSPTDGRVHCTPLSAVTEDATAVRSSDEQDMSPLSDVTNLVTPTVGGSGQAHVQVMGNKTVHYGPVKISGGKENKGVSAGPSANSGISVNLEGGAISQDAIDFQAREEMRKAKNRIRQQEYRKRKREEREKAEEGYDIQTPTLPTVENGQDQPPKKRKYVRKNKTVPGNKQDNVSTPNLHGLDPTLCSGVTEQKQTPASVNRFPVDVTPVSALTTDHGQTGSKLNQSYEKDGHVVVDGWLHRNDDYLPSYSAVMRNNDGNGEQGVTPDQTQRVNRIVYMKEYMSKRRKKQKEEEAARVATEKTGVARDDEVGHHGNWYPDENDNIHFGEEDLDAADPGVQYDLPVEEQDEEARLYGLRGMYLR
ncbi:hypothetical protein EJB05_50455 [Eragrostis curvula]|uniref:Uncharacterized protein n=1 Tax=Eragrostis curvula TaxID=38414 RepID=A0A5J9SZN4_9POAL|nr:hypothetical protein EJB05_50455 [Eragrostis curvula]